MKYRISASIRDVNDAESKATIRVSHELDNPLANCFLRELFLAILKGMKDYNEDKFMDAMIEFIHEEMNNEN